MGVVVVVAVVVSVAFYFAYFGIHVCLVGRVSTSSVGGTLSLWPSAAQVPLSGASDSAAVATATSDA